MKESGNLTAQDKLNLKTRHLYVDGIGSDRNTLQSSRNERLRIQELTPMSEETSSLIRMWLVLTHNSYSTIVFMVAYSLCGLPNAVVYVNFYSWGQGGLTSSVKSLTYSGYIILIFAHFYLLSKG